MPTTKAQQKAVNKYMKDNYDRVTALLPKGTKDDLQAHVDRYADIYPRPRGAGGSVNAFLMAAIETQMQADRQGARRSQQQGKGAAFVPDSWDFDEPC